MEIIIRRVKNDFFHHLRASNSKVYCAIWAKIVLIGVVVVVVVMVVVVVVVVVVVGCTYFNVIWAKRT